jgi:hypothetical protein
MKVEWENPVFRDVSFEQGSEETVAVKKQALPFEKAVAYLAGEDKRPLLILRECYTCSGTDDALLSRKGGNEKTFVYTKWFNCVRVPATVTEADHAFHNLFSGEKPPHLFVCSADGKNVRPLKGDQSMLELWDVLSEALSRDYVRDPAKVYKSLVKLYMEFDMLDDEEELLLGQAYRELLNKGGDSKKLPKLRKKLDVVRDKREEALKKEKVMMNLQLKAELASAAKNASAKAGS